MMRRVSNQRSLALHGFAFLNGMTLSILPSRHRGYVSILRPKDRDAAIAYLNRMTAAIAVNDATPPADTDGAAVNDITHTTSNGDMSNETI